LHEELRADSYTPQPVRQVPATDASSSRFSAARRRRGRWPLTTRKNSLASPRSRRACRSSAGHERGDCDPCDGVP
jgi:hypothetical protein